MTVRVWLGTEETTNVSPTEPSADQLWHADGSEDLAAVILIANAVIPATYLGLYRGNYTSRHKGAGFWDLEVHYQKAIVLKAGEFTYTGKTSGKSLHRTQSLETVHWFSADGTDQADVPDYGGLIGVSEDRIEGVDTVGPGYSFTITKKFGANSLSPTFLQALSELKPCVNDAAFTFVWKTQVFQYDRGELLLADLTYNDGGKDTDEQEMFDVVYEFEFSKNLAAPITIDGAQGDIVVNEKEGHHYSWQRNQRVRVNDYTAEKPLAVYVERVYDYADFGSLQLG